MTEIRAAKRTRLHERVGATTARALAAVELSGNEWGGFDLTPASRGGYVNPDASHVRVTPIDGDWRYGFDAYVFSANDVLLAQANVHAGTTTPELVATVATALWRKR